MNTNETIFECFGCGEKMAYRGSIPRDWKTIKIFGIAHLFCSRCCCHMKSHPGMEHPIEISPSLKEDLHKRHGLVFEEDQ